MRKIDLSVGEFYHVYNRGTDKRELFLSSSDQVRFVKLLYLCNSDQSVVFREIPVGSAAYALERGETIVDIGAYCLMPNHFHLLLHEKRAGGITKFMGKLSTSYSMYFNKKNKRSGALFESRFKAKHADTDEYLKYLFAYIHLNPVKIIDPEWKESGLKDNPKTKRYLDTYEYSSYPEYLGVERKQGKIIEPKAFPEYFLEQKGFEDFISDWLSMPSE